jgi:hypothetical protein
MASDMRNMLEEMFTADDVGRLPVLLIVDKSFG